MYFESLPVVVLEILFFYLDVKDLVNISRVIALDLSDSFWKKICIREDYKKIKEKDDSWKSVFQYHTNWLMSNYVHHNYTCIIYNKSVASPNNNCLICNKDMVHGKPFIIQNNNEYTSNKLTVLDIEETPEVVQTLADCYYMKQSTSKLATYDFSKLKIYSIENKRLNTLLTIPWNGNFEFNLSSLTDHFFAAFERESSSITIISISDLYLFNVSTKNMKHIYQLVIFNTILHILVLEGNEYVLKRFNITCKKWIDDILLFKGAFFIMTPKLKISSDLIVSWSDHLERKDITPIKIWSLDGRMMKTMTVNSFYSTKKVQLNCNNILWMIVEGDYIMFSVFTTSIIIWTSQNPDHHSEVSKVNHFYKGQSVVLSSYLVLVYVDCFKIIDFKKAEYLYDILFDNHNYLNKSLNAYCDQLYYYINEYYCLIFEKNNEIAENIKESCNFDSLCCNTSITNKIRKTYTMSMYDFSGT